MGKQAQKRTPGRGVTDWRHRRRCPDPDPVPFAVQPRGCPSVRWNVPFPGASRGQVSPRSWPEGRPLACGLTQPAGTRHPCSGVPGPRAARPVLPGPTACSPAVWRGDEVGEVAGAWLGRARGLGSAFESLPGPVQRGILSLTLGSDRKFCGCVRVIAEVRMILGEVKG